MRELLEEKKNWGGLYPQDLHIHTVFSEGDGSIVPQQTLAFISQFRHAETIGISDHFHLIQDVEDYFTEVQRFGFRIGTEVSNLKGARIASQFDFEYYILHCRDEDDYYKAADVLLDTGKPLIIAHPISMKTNLDRVSSDAFVEMNNHYVWQGDWKSFYAPYLDRFRFLPGSDAHQPHWLNQDIARKVMEFLGVSETILFPQNKGA